MPTYICNKRCYQAVTGSKPMLYDEGHVVTLDEPIPEGTECLKYFDRMGDEPIAEKVEPPKPEAPKAVVKKKAKKKGKK